MLIERIIESQERMPGSLGRTCIPTSGYFLRQKKSLSKIFEQNNIYS